MERLKIVASITALEEYKDVVYAELVKVVDGTRTESGNIYYDLHVDVKEPLKFVIVEHWENQTALDLHEETEHFKSFVKAIEGKTEGLEILKIKEIY